MHSYETVRQLLIDFAKSDGIPEVGYKALREIVYSVINSDGREVFSEIDATDGGFYLSEDTDAEDWVDRIMSDYDYTFDKDWECCTDNDGQIIFYTGYYPN